MAYTPIEFKDKYNELLPSLIESGFTTEGQFTKKCESLLAEKFKTESIITSSWGTAFQAVLSYYKQSISSEPENEKPVIIFQSNSFYGAIMIAREMGFEICYTPCDNNDVLNMSFVHLIETIKYISPKKQILLVLTHIGGWVNSAAKEITELCQQYNIPVIEDCAHSFNSKGYDGVFSGTYGNVGIFSFYATKAIQAGEGGAIISKDKNLINYVRVYSRYDRENHHKHISLSKDDYHVFTYGQNIRVSEYQALALYITLELIDSFYESRLKNIAEYNYENIPNEKRYPQHLYNKFSSFNESTFHHNYYKFVIDLAGGDGIDNGWYIDFKNKHKAQEVGPTFDYNCPILDVNNRRTFHSYFHVEQYLNEQELKNNLRYLKTI